jgi:ABC-type transporter Mla subunit MlaD
MRRMPLRIGGLHLRTPSDLASAARSVLGWTDEAVQVVADLPARVAALVDEAERLVTRVGATLDRVDAAVGRVEGTLADVADVAGDARALVVRVGDVADGAAKVSARAAEVADGAAHVADGANQVVERIVPITGSAEAVLESVGATSADAQALLEIFQPIGERGAPLLQHFIDEFSVEELHALVRLVDQVPQFTEHMETDIMPVLAKLDQVGPDVHELLDVLKDVRLAIQGVPGFALFRRRGAEKDDELADERPEG